MGKIYKPSMFNHCVDNDEANELILFNSYLGAKCLLRVPNEKKEKVMRWLSQQVIMEDAVKEDEDYLFLLEEGYFLDAEVDEKRLREVLLNKIKADNTLRLVIHTSKSCNFRCKYCYLYFDNQSDGNLNISKDTQDGIINFVRKNIANYRAVHVDWFGGEPLLDIEAIEYISKNLINICNRAKKAYEAVITTNGYLLTERNIHILLKSKVRHFAVTIDGIKEQHDALRVLKNGASTFDQIISNLIYIRDNVKTHALSISLRSNLTIESIKRLEDYYQFYNNLFGNDPRFYLFVRPVKDMGGERIEQLEGLLFQNNTEDFGIVYERLGKIIGKLKFTANFIDLQVGGMYCLAGNLNRFTIGIDGVISKCDESLDEIGIGYLTPSGEMIIDKSKESEWLITVPNSKKCDDCFYSCCCFADPCPKARVARNSGGCPAAVGEIDSLLKFYVQSCEVRSL